MTNDHRQELPKTFDPAAIEARWYAHWEGNGLFRPERPDAPPYTIVNPPPNVTGSLHIGHALDNTLQDIMIRYERLRGKDALWVVGTDHAGIATQMVVERQMEAKGDKRANYTREQFVEKVWEWKAESGGTITHQLRRLGCSMDWSREQFTMDPHFTKAVLKVFVDLYNKGLIYRDKRLVNWDPKLKTAISDLEVETRETQGGFWRFRYPFADGSGAVEVATTRPETMLADMAVAVNPADDRYMDVIGKDILQPITGRTFQVVADEHADPELGSGVVKITPGHDFNDFEVGKRAGIKPADMLNMFDAEAKVVQTADGLIPQEFIGLDRFDARKLVVERMKEAGFLIPHVTKDKDGEEVSADFEPRTIQTPYGDRGGVVVEPWLTDQWYVDAEKLAQAPMQAVRDGRIEIVPKTWEKTFFHWMENIQPWTISRQLWWGHRIPAWYGTPLGVFQNLDQPIFDRDWDNAPVFVAETEDEARQQAEEYYRSQLPEELEIVVEFRDAGGHERNGDSLTAYLVRDRDVLDTWFSSALWPFATLGWPDDTALLKKHYPNDLLISGFDILFFWDARMAMQGMEFMDGQVPWKRLYLHGLVRAADGAKMSKSKGNVVDPLGLIDRYGADALRFFMAAMESQGRDIKMDDKRVEGYRNFATKLWNAARFCQSNGIGGSTRIEPPAATLAVNQWIIAETVATVQAMDLALADLRFDAAANTIYQFVWSRFCDWYLELIKPILSKVEGPVLSKVEGPVLNPGGPSQSVGAEPVEAPSFSAADGESTALRQAQGEWDGDDASETRAVAGWVLDQILVLLHPFMPFITEELWSKLADRSDYPLITAKWPLADARALDPAASREIDWLIRLVGEVRAARTELNLPPGTRLPLHVRDAGDETRTRLARNAAALQRLARVELADGDPSGGAAQVVVDEATFILPLEGVIDLAAERERLTKAIAAAAKERDSLAGRLNNPSFVERAKPEAVEKARADHAERASEAERLGAALARLG